MMVPPDGEGVPLLYVTIVMLALSWVTLVGRVAVRQYIDAFGLDDWLMCIGLLLYTVTASLVIACCFYGAGVHAGKLEQATMMQGIKLFYIAEFFYSACTVPIKCSICVTLLRIADARRRFVWTLWAIMGATAVATVIFIIIIANLCHPITTLWLETTTGSCNFELNSSASYFFSAVSIVTDWTLAVLPAVLLWNIQMKGRVKVTVVLMLGLAAFASCATVVRLRYLTLYNNPNDFMYSTGAIGLWSIIEEGIGIIAGSMPALRPLLNLAIFRRGTYASGESGDAVVPTFGTVQGDGHHHHPHQQHDEFDTHRVQHANAVRMDTFRPQTTTKAGQLRKNRVRGSEDDDCDSQKHILKETQVTVTSQHSPANNDWARQQVLGWNNRKY